jgi:hypothetical protein
MAAAEGFFQRRCCCCFPWPCSTWEHIQLSCNRNSFGIEGFVVVVVVVVAYLFIRIN